MMQEKEKTFSIDTLIVSTTDSKGNILYINEAFLDISGYTEKELLGKPHNIVRHSDMPKQAFKTIWEDYLLQGKEWSGVVKNLCKDRKLFYVVYAHITPIIKGNKIVGYTSVRRCPTQQEKDEYLAIYKTMKNNYY